MAKAKSRSKWLGKLEGLTPLPPEDPKYQDKVNAAKDEFNRGSEFVPDALAAALEAEVAIRKLEIASAGFRVSTTHTAESFSILYSQARRAKEALEEAQKIVQIRLTALEQLIVSSQSDGDPGWGEYGAAENMLRMKSGAAIRIDYEPVGKVTDKDKFRLWCVANGHENSLQLWPTTMQAIAKRRFDEGESIPDGVEIHSRAKLVYSKGGDD